MGFNSINDIFTADTQHAYAFKKISSTDVKYSPFFAYKQWTIPSGSSTSSALPLMAIYSKSPTKNGLPPIGSNLAYDNSKNINNSLRIITYYSINNLIYKRKDQPYDTYGGTDLKYTKKALYLSASILSFPYGKVGEGIKPKSFTFNVPSTLSLKSDKYGNIYDTAIDTGSFASSLAFYEGFNEYFDTTRIKSYTYSNVTFVPGIPTTSGTAKSVGYAAKFNGNSYMQTTFNNTYNTTDDYAISFWVSASNASTTSSFILGKVVKEIDTKFPFKIELNANSKIVFAVSSDNLHQTIISSSTNVTQWTNVICQKTGSMIELYIDGTLNSSGSLNNWISKKSVSLNNLNPIQIGSISGSSTTNSLNGCIDELRIYNKALTSTNITSLNNRAESTSTFLQTANVGTVLHKQGLAIISSPHYKYDNILNLNYTTTHKSTKRVYELNVVTRIPAGDFNMSLNPSLLTADNETYQSFVTGSEFSPYITTVGLYDNHGRLIAIGKLGQAIKKHNDVDMNIVIRIDLDAPISWNDYGITPASKTPIVRRPPPPPRPIPDDILLAAATPTMSFGYNRQ